MAERSSSASSEQYSKLSQTGNESRKDSKSKKRSRRKQKKEKLVEQSVENVQAAESSSLLLTTAEHSESKQTFTEFVQNTGDHEGNLGQAMATEPTAKLVQDAGVSEANASNLPVADATSKSRKDLAREENVVADKIKELPKEERASNDREGKGKAEHKPLEQKQGSAKNKMDLLSFGRSKKNKTQKNSPQETSGEKTRDNKESVGAEGGSVSHTAKSKFLDKENEQEVGEDRELDEPETSAMEEADNSPEDVKTVENNEGSIGEHKRAQKAMNTAGSNKAKKFKPLASFRRHKKKSDPAKSASADESTGEKAEAKHHLKAERDDEVFEEGNGDKVSNNEEEEEKTGSNENARKKSTGKKFSPLRSFRRSKASKKSTGAGKDGHEESKGTHENSHVKDSAKKEACEDSDVLQQEHGAQQSDEGVSAECTGEENPEQTPEEEEIQAKCDSDAEAMTPTKKEKKKGLLRRQMKKMWSTSGKSKEASDTEKAEGENVADERSEVQDENGDPQASSPQNPPNPPAEASSEEGAAIEKLPANGQEELVESADLISTTAKTEIKKADETNLEAAPMEGSTDAETHSTEKTEKIKKSTTKSQIKNGDGAKLIEETSGASGVDNKEISKQVKRKRSGFQKISNALKRKKSREDSWQNEDEPQNEEGLREKGPQETDRQTANAEVNSDEDEEQRPLDHDKADANDHEINKGEAEKELQSDQEETEKINDSKECPAEENINESAERQENCKDTSATEDSKAHGNLMKAVIQELLEKIAKIQANRASASAEPETEPEEESEFTKTSDDNSLTEVTSTTGDSSPSSADACNDDRASEDSVKLEGKLQETNETDGYQDGGLSDDTKDVDADADSTECVPNSTEYVPNTPEAERERPDETSITEIQTYDADSSAVPTSIPEVVPNSTEAETSGKRAISEDVGIDSEIHRGSENSEEGDNEESEASQENQEREITAKSAEDLHKSNVGVTSDLDSSQTAPSKGRKEDWILVNHLEISQELSHQLKVLALDSFEHGTQGCCSMM